MLAIQIQHTGGPEVLVPAEIEEPQPGPGEIRIRHGAIGLNYVETYYRKGAYPLALPAVLGQEAAGTVDAVGLGVTRFQVGDRAAYASGSSGAYAQYATINEGKAVKLPDSISDDQAAAVMLKGLTVEMLTRRCYVLKPGQSALVHAAAGGVGGLLVQWCKAIGTTVVAGVGSQAKADIAKAKGADHVILYEDPAWPDAVRGLSGGRGVDVVYDGVGQATGEGSLKSLARRGWLIVYGAASGPAPMVDPLALMRQGSITFVRPTLFDYIAKTEELGAAAEDLFAMMQSGAVTPEIGQRFALKDAADAHRALEGRATTGSTLLIP